MLEEAEMDIESIFSCNGHMWFAKYYAEAWYKTAKGADHQKLFLYDEVDKCNAGDEIKIDKIESKKSCKNIWLIKKFSVSLQCESKINDV